MTTDEVREIVWLISIGLEPQDIAPRFGVRTNQIRRIVNKETGMNWREYREHNEYEKINLYNYGGRPNCWRNMQEKLGLIKAR